VRITLFVHNYADNHAPREPLPQGDGDGAVVTLGHVNNMLGIIQDIVTKDLMDIRTGIMCYEYIDAYEEE